MSIDSLATVPTATSALTQPSADPPRTNDAGELDQRPAAGYPLPKPPGWLRAQLGPVIRGLTTAYLKTIVLDPNFKPSVQTLMTRHGLRLDDKQAFGIVARLHWLGDRLATQGSPTLEAIARDARAMLNRYFEEHNTLSVRREALEFANRYLNEQDTAIPHVPAQSDSV